MKKLITILFVTVLFSCQPTQPVTEPTEKQMGVIYSSTLQTQINNLSTNLYNANAALVAKGRNDSVKMQSQIAAFNTIVSAHDIKIKSIYDSLKLTDTIRVGKGLAYDLTTKTIYIP